MTSNSATDPETTFQKLTPATSGHGTGEERPAGWNMLDDSLAANQRWSTWNNVERLMRGPTPRPGFIIEDAGAIDTELGILKTGKEADVFLLERATDTRRSLLAAKRYRPPEQRAFRRSTIYTEGRTVRRSRDARALKNGSSYGRQVEAAQWAAAEWNFLVRAHEAGIPVPYPVQVDGTEILMEFITDPDHPDAAAPRLQQLRPTRPVLQSFFDQLVEAMGGFASLGYAHGDLSPYNILVSGNRLVIIDLPQLVDLAANPLGADLLARDCRNVCSWFTSRGLDQDPEELLADLLAAAWT
ncbi:MAG: serine protein kinase RIO [Arthrobacter sp.]|uniref:serine protein kinase RIO n=1 Tax=Arthrobacter TaxID=1663 RepID=UPI00264EEC79|nr:serine/threonine protein kinase [Micrococcaceae bacterium]MDN5824276.1 serine/threonine protein kinase [Micrococcaceae bacterium]MDN5878488.1 serine/threonine protein kinase [Micrococcaceae bacterium]MDN5885456.1 serine/threonine protein kinase [Micrococcaceae bacterium]MDN5904005.1 serine/threonine protein kinase [Micrococcaceae bacterium]